jgi:Leucine-rich repeat (LRR) protein
LIQTFIIFLFLSDILGNLTVLEILDLSNNRIKDLTDPDNPFILPMNLTHIYLQNNLIEKIDYERFKKLAYIQEINLENNLLERLNKTMVDLIRNGVSVHFQGEFIVHLKKRK